MEILQQLDDAFSSDPSIDEIGFMFDEGTSVLLTEHKLGIPIKCLKQVWLYILFEIYNVIYFGTYIAVKVLLETTEGEVPRRRTWCRRR
jgi:hypothetical protein